MIKDFEGYYVGSASRNYVNGLYTLQGETFIGCYEIPAPIHEAYTLSSCDSSKVALWHRRLGHYHLQGIRRMMQFGAVKGLPKIPISNLPCSSCILGKQSRKSIPKAKTTLSISTLQLIHLDVVGPFRVRSLGGACYFLTFIDDYSKKTWVYFLSSKDQVLEKFKNSHQEVERMTRHKIGTLELTMVANIHPRHSHLIVTPLIFSCNSLNHTLLSTME